MKYLSSNVRYLQDDTRFITYDTPVSFRLVYNQVCEDGVDSYTCHYT